jgi:transcriptional regulator with XRE-family HTH domain
MEDIRLRFGKAARNLRHKLGVTQEEFADICGLDRTYIGGIERVERNVSLIDIERIAKALKISIPRLFNNGQTSSSDVLRPVVHLELGLTMSMELNKQSSLVRWRLTLLVFDY